MRPSHQDGRSEELSDEESPANRNKRLWEKRVFHLRYLELRMSCLKFRGWLSPTSNFRHRTSVLRGFARFLQFQKIETRHSKFESRLFPGFRLSFFEFRLYQFSAALWLFGFEFVFSNL